MYEKFTETHKEYILRRIDKLSPWYHKIHLGNGIFTPGRNYDLLWNNIREVMNLVDYDGKAVLDIASWDGMWAFEAESRGASTVVATDTRLIGFPNLLFCREILESNVIPMCNVKVQELSNRLQVVGLPRKFDIIQHLGLFYHLRDPLLSLAQARSVMPEGGILILETAFIDDDENSYMAFAGLPGSFHFYGITDTWVPTKLCLKEILSRSMFKPVHQEKWQIKEQALQHKDKNIKFGRIVMLAEAVSDSSVHAVDLRKIEGIQ